MNKCCGKGPTLRKYRNVNTGYIYWYECPNCGRRNSYGYSTPKEAERAWNNGLTTKINGK